VKGLERPEKIEELGDFREREHRRRKMAERPWKNIIGLFVMCFTEDIY
jgi:hypothetical protein